ncbi:mitochondrial fission ELM1 family protein [Luteimonas sp. SDU82]|uniref:mitochondrial fission ELM1 family protein n=1 Tax=Luteimonas sp. SDU82 TaxID=3422592 RepID=UPI003EB8E311
MIAKLERLAGHGNNSPQIWALSDGRAGNARQAEALAAALGGPTRTLQLAPRAPWRWAAPRALPGARAAFGSGFGDDQATPPSLAIGCGRQAALATRLLRRCGAAAVQILDPRIDPRHWDVVVVPEHDGLDGPNVVQLLGSLHPVDDDWLSRARAQFPQFALLPGPRTALLLGGPTGNAPFDAAGLEAVLDRLERLRAAEGGSVLATVSRRTPPALAARLRQRLASVPGLCWTGTQDGANPYPGLLAWADRIVCSPDSVNMVSEACATGAPVHVFDRDRCRGRIRRFLDVLDARGRLGPLEASAGGIVPLRETRRVSDEIRARLGLGTG